MTDISMGVFAADLYHQAVIKDHDLLFTVHEDEREVPSDYPAVVKLWMSGTPYRVYGGASDTSIYAKYSDVSGNHRFRVVHDWLHFAFGHDFSVRAETNLGLLHAFNARQWLMNEPSYRQWADDAASVLLADTLGQTWVYATQQAFVDDQAEFVERVLCCGNLLHFLDLLNQPKRALADFDLLVGAAGLLDGLDLTYDFEPEV